MISVVGEVPEAFARLFPTARERARVATDAGVDLQLVVNESLPPLIAWAWILEAAKQQQKLTRIVEMALREIPDDPVLARAIRQARTDGLSSPGPDRAAQIVVRTPNRSLSVGGVTFQYVPYATALVGSDDGYEHERPRHPVRLSSFFLQETPVTNAQFAAFCQATGYQTSAELGTVALCPVNGDWRPMDGADWRHPLGPGTSLTGKEDHPVVQVNWYDAGLYCRWLAESAGVEVVLPTEVRWEYAASGPRALRWPLGDLYAPGSANFEGTGTSPVGTFAANDFGLFDMAGNALEWCADWYSTDWGQAGHALAGPPTHDPTGVATGRFKLLRGGSWFDVPRHGRCTNRYFAAPILASANWGFRCCLPLSDDLLRTLAADPTWGLHATDMVGGGG